MASIPKKVAERLVSGLKRYQPVLAAAKARDVGETERLAWEQNHELSNLSDQPNQKNEIQSHHYATEHR